MFQVWIPTFIVVVCLFYFVFVVTKQSNSFFYRGLQLPTSVKFILPSSSFYFLSQFRNKTFSVWFFSHWNDWKLKNVMFLSSIIHMFKAPTVLWYNLFHMDISSYDAHNLFSQLIYSFNRFSIFSLCVNDKSIYFDHIATVRRASIRSLSRSLVINNQRMFQPESQTPISVIAFFW